MEGPLAEEREGVRALWEGKAASLNDCFKFDKEKEKRTSMV